MSDRAHYIEDGGLALFYLSFCDDEKPKGSQFLGACVVESHVISDIAGAVSEAWRLGINPGGQVLCVQIPDERRWQYQPLMGRLLSRAELDAAVGDMKTVGQLEREEPGRQ